MAYSLTHRLSILVQEFLLHFASFFPAGDLLAAIMKYPTKYWFNCRTFPCHPCARLTLCDFDHFPFTFFFCNPVKFRSFYVLRLKSYKERNFTKPRIRISFPRRTIWLVISIFLLDNWTIFYYSCFATEEVMFSWKKKN